MLRPLPPDRTEPSAHGPACDGEPGGTGARVLIIDDHASFAESLELALGLDGHRVQRIGTESVGARPAAMLPRVLRIRPRVVLLDLDLGDLGDSLPLIRPLAEAGVNVVVVTASADRGRWGACIRQGARRVISKGAPLLEIRSTVRRIIAGQSVMTPEERHGLLTAWRQHYAAAEADRERFEALSPRERQVLGELMLGRSVREIAAGAVVSEATVRTQVKSVLSKLGVSSQLAAVGLAHHVGWSPPRDPMDKPGG